MITIGWLLARTQDGGLPQFFSPKVGRDHGQPAGGWTSDEQLGLRFAREADVREFVKTYMAFDAPFVKPFELKGFEPTLPKQK